MTDKQLTDARFYGTLGYEVGIVSTATAQAQHRRHMEKTRCRYGIPDSTIEVDVEGYKVSNSELATHTGNTGKLISRLWRQPGVAYGYAILADGRFLHGALHMHSDKTVSFS